MVGRRCTQGGRVVGRHIAQGVPRGVVGRHIAQGVPQGGVVGRHIAQGVPQGVGREAYTPLLHTRVEGGIYTTVTHPGMRLPGAFWPRNPLQKAPLDKALLFRLQTEKKWFYTPKVRSRLFSRFTVGKRFWAMGPGPGLSRNNRNNRE